jgi:hypothetical protein
MINESGVAGAERVKSRADFKHFLDDYRKLISQYPGFESMNPSGSYNSDLSKQDFGDIDLIVHIKSDKTKPELKKDLQNWFHKQPDTVIVPFSSPKYVGKRSYNSGEIVTVRYHDDELGYSAQIDNIIALDSEEAEFKQKFLDYPAAKQGLILGLVKIATIETDPNKLFKMLNINIKKLDPAGIGADQEYEFNLSSNELQLRKVVYEPGTFKQADRTILWTTRNMADVSKLLYQYNLDDNFAGLLKQAKEKIHNPRSKNRIEGVFTSMVSVKSGEVGTKKGEDKISDINAVKAAFSGDAKPTLTEYFAWVSFGRDMVFEAETAKTVVIFAGRFQPFHRGHAQTYHALQEQFPGADVWVATSGKTGPDSPFDFSERKQLAELMGIPGNRIAEVKQPYMATEILNHYNPEKDHVIYAISAKDADRIKFGIKKDGSPTYLQPYKSNEEMLPFDLKTGHGYVTIAPVVNFKVAGETITGATSIRDMLAQHDSALNTRVLQDLYGKNADKAAAIILPHFK